MDTYSAIPIGPSMDPRQSPLGLLEGAGLSRALQEEAASTVSGGSWEGLRNYYGVGFFPNLETQRNIDTALASINTAIFSGGTPLGLVNDGSDLTNALTAVMHQIRVPQNPNIAGEEQAKDIGNMKWASMDYAYSDGPAGTQHAGAGQSLLMDVLTQSASPTSLSAGHGLNIAQGHTLEHGLGQVISQGHTIEQSLSHDVLAQVKSLGSNIQSQGATPLFDALSPGSQGYYQSPSLPGIASMARGGMALAA